MRMKIINKGKMEVRFLNNILLFELYYYFLIYCLGIYKACLLSGPPGIGKTTAAKLICKELGFNIFEQNSSDQRNKSIINVRQY